MRFLGATFCRGLDNCREIPCMQNKHQSQGMLSVGFSMVQFSQLGVLIITDCDW